MKERRQFERFQLSVPARVRIISPEEKQVFDLWTMNISASGAFLDTTEQFAEGTQFCINLTVPSERIKELTGAESFVKVEGKVVRSTPAGVAVHFEKDCQIMSLKSM